MPTRTIGSPRRRLGLRGGVALLVVLLAAGGVLAWALGGSAGKVTPENYARIRTGMTEAEVRAVLGEPSGEREGADTAARAELRTLFWRKGNDQVVVTCRAGKVVKRSATFRGGPEEQPSKDAGPALTEAKFGKLREQMPFEEVKRLFGPPTREEASNLPISGVSFRLAHWESGFDNVSLQFRDEKLTGGIGAINGKMLAVKLGGKP